MESWLLGVNIALFFSLQIVANLLFKWGSGEGHWWYGFLGGNLVGAISVIFYMYMFSRLPGNLAAAIGSGGAFLLIQLAIVVCYRVHLTFGQWSGIMLICSGIVLMALCCGGTD